MASFTAAGTAYATHGVPMVPFFIFYSMFGFQRVGDLIWAAGDSAAAGFLLGATAGRTTLNGEGLQHQDGHSLVLASTVPNVRRLRPRLRLRGRRDRPGRPAPHVRRRARGRLLLPHLYNENYVMPADARGRRATASLRGLYRFADAPDGPVARGPRSCSPGRRSGAARRGAATARRALRRRRRAVDRHVVQGPARGRAGGRALEPPAPVASRRARRTSPSCSSEAEGPFVAVTDFMKAVPDQIARWVPGPLHAARHRRLRPLRHPRGAAPPLRDRRRPRRRRRARRAGPSGRGQARGGGRRHRPLRHRPRRARPEDRLSGAARETRRHSEWRRRVPSS